jgi:uncharacterized protein
MAGTSLLALIDDLATLLDDVSVMTKIAAKKTAGVLGDDLALNAEQVTGVVSDRELPVVWAVAKGSFLNKAILVPAALAIAAFASWLITPLLMIGGAFLCFEGFEKVAHKLLHSEEEVEGEHDELLHAFNDSEVDMVAFEKEKIKGAIRTDFILSAEIIVISLGTMSNADLTTQMAALVTLSILFTTGVYGLVAGIVKLDDAGFYLEKKDGAAKGLGTAIIHGTPYLMKGLSLVGTIAMFLVGGGIIAHGVPFLADLTHKVEHMGGVAGLLGPTLVGGLTGVVAGGMIVAIVTVIQKARGKKTAH